MCALLKQVYDLVTGFLTLYALFLVVTYVPTTLYSKYTDYHCVVSAEDGVAQYVRALQGRCPNTKNVWVFDKTDSNVVLFWCKHYHIMSHTHITLLR